eukprot:CAMPEP_0194194728 /NCGR_PEP_ID=MMETSP0154-20130528/75740_1 /TAXON_ID=1049557 /ORGANISM="Thalassiothrix antarctica, Strain L6-D1" /LENGTH=299 /DNA_ID=CAMNT_0038919183 /DNA_START=68 /DNA_END=968 /DNA_ORIENTATION=-
MKFSSVLSFALATSSASAFVSTPSKSNSNALAAATNKGGLMDLAKAQNNVVQYYDPLALADKDFWDQGEEATIGFLRQAEIKHGRVAMAAFVGYCVQRNYQWPFAMKADKDFWDQGEEATIGFLRQAEIKHGRVAMAAFVGYCVQRNYQWPFAMKVDGTPFPASNMSPEAQWDNLPEEAKWQIFTFIALLEVLDESNCGDLEARPHYMRGGQPGKFPDFGPLPNLYDPFGLFKKMSDEQKARRLNMEVNNGRLAMLGIFGFLSADSVPGSVPALTEIAKPYAGNIMVPFEGQFTLFGSS